ncbi:hypothetical protein [Streptomyces sp. SP17KL33]|uniref:hypothetical protein n=1 Tax=Streptomyces sp. SP17KL33 TaxID=3002534 RepID=UPI002E779F92|nr:hypothetical protein [Streptomyces sp. SP17KL33]MEE1835769.1 hypothetical protein [Streptomyces sp. SP17KL33]
MNTTVTETSGKHFGTVRNGDRIAYRTPGYYTAQMALAAAECWVAFHGEDTMPTYTLALEHDAHGRMPLGSVVKGKHTPKEYATKGEAWEAVQRSFYAAPVSVLEDGKPVATFSWQFKTADEPHPGKPGYVRRVRDLCKWTGAGWVATGVQSVGAGTDRFIRTV